MRRVLIAGLVVVALLGVVIVAYFVGPAMVERIRRTEFDSREWHEGTALQRGRMAHDLASSGRLHGLTQKEVIEILGVPDHQLTIGFGYTVDIGHRFGSTPWLYTLVIRVDDDGRVNEVYLHD